VLTSRTEYALGDIRRDEETHEQTSHVIRRLSPQMLQAIAVCSTTNRRIGKEEPTGHPIALLSPLTPLCTTFDHRLCCLEQESKLRIDIVASGFEILRQERSHHYVVPLHALPSAYSNNVRRSVAMRRGAGSIVGFEVC
jgi:hypothetical protein